MKLQWDAIETSSWETGEMIGFFCLLLFLIILQIFFLVFYFWSSYLPREKKIKSLEHMWGFVGFLTN